MVSRILSNKFWIQNNKMTDSIQDWIKRHFNSGTKVNETIFWRKQYTLTFSWHGFTNSKSRIPTSKLFDCQQITNIIDHPGLNQQTMLNIFSWASIASKTSESVVVRPRATLQIMEWIRFSSVLWHLETISWSIESMELQKI